MPKSPITHSDRVKLIQTFQTKELIEKWLQWPRIDISAEFANVKEIQLNECEDTHLRFFSPPEISGSAELYKQLQKFDWYYMPWKWEHEIAVNYVNQETKLLEIGCAKGDFLIKISELCQECVGIELNPEAADIARSKGLNVLNETIVAHSVVRENYYDMVCAFQVLEHVSDIRLFIDASLRALKPGGSLIFSVPNNDSFVRDSFNLLNMPPHHISLWTPDVFLNLAKYFPIKVVKTHIEPLQSYHFNYFFQTQLKKRIKMPELCHKALSILLFPLYYPVLRCRAESINGLTLLAIMEKK